MPFATVYFDGWLVLNGGLEGCVWSLFCLIFVNFGIKITIFLKFFIKTLA